MYRTFNCGVGMVICVPAAQLTQCLSILQAQGETAWVLGCIEAGEGEARVELNV
jgi:phosphoribosylformylglycinamidine cyclo-ligase